MDGGTLRAPTRIVVLLKTYRIYKVILQRTSQQTYESDRAEPVGTKTKIWIRDPQNKRWLCKKNRVRETTGEVTGEDWSEVIAARICRALTIPHAYYDFALW